MDPIDFPGRNVIMGEGQPEYRPLYAYRDPSSDCGEVISVWKPTFIERIKILFGAQVCSSLATFYRPIQPQLLYVARVQKVKTWRQRTKESLMKAYSTLRSKVSIRRKGVSKSDTKST